jgi:hypothetical protein
MQMQTNPFVNSERRQVIDKRGQVKSMKVKREGEGQEGDLLDVDRLIRRKEWKELFDCENMQIDWQA